MDDCDRYVRSAAGPRRLRCDGHPLQPRSCMARVARHARTHARCRLTECGDVGRCISRGSTPESQRGPARCEIEDAKTMELCDRVMEDVKKKLSHRRMTRVPRR